MGVNRRDFIKGTTLLGGAAVLGVSIDLHAMTFSKQATGDNAKFIQGGENAHRCKECGMSLKMFWKTSHAVELEDGTIIQYCSIRDLVKAEKEQNLKVKKYMAVDAKTEKLSDATKMTYVVGSKVMGTMSSVSKIAFNSKDDALEFQKEFGGELRDFDYTKKFSLEILQKDIEMIKKKKAMMKAKMEAEAKNK